MKVTLSGLGGDEFFGGYPSFQRFSKYGSYARAWGRSPEPLRSGVAAAVRAVGDRSVGTLKTAALLESDGSLPQMFPIMRELFSTAQRSALLSADVQRIAGQVDDPYVSLLRSAEERSRGLGTMSLVSYAEARTYMHDVLLRDTDQMSMRWGLEVRVPLLDHRVIEYLMSLPDAVKEPGDRPKALLLDSLARPLPATCVSRPKQGFVLPFAPWMRGELRSFCEMHLQALADRPFLRAETVQALWSSFLEDDRRVSWSRPWTLVALDAWLEQTQIQA
jgi:asparagine synthase (glutamine-hydrolysing)